MKGQVVDMLAEMTLEELQTELGAIQDEIGRRKEAEFHSENACLVGRAFVNRTSYSCPESDADYWDFYTFVKELSDGNGLNAVRVSKDVHGRVLIEDVHTYPHLLGAEISRTEYDTAVNAIMKHARAFAGIR
jgi:hypothetical protein